VICIAEDARVEGGLEADLLALDGRNQKAFVNGAPKTEGRGGRTLTKNLGAEKVKSREVFVKKEKSC